MILKFKTCSTATRLKKSMIKILNVICNECCKKESSPFHVYFYYQVIQSASHQGSRRYRQDPYTSVICNRSCMLMYRPVNEGPYFTAICKVSDSDAYDSIYDQTAVHL